MIKTRNARRRLSMLLGAAAPVALLLGLAAPASAQIAGGGGNTAAGTVSNTYTTSGAVTSFTGATANTGGADTSTITLNAPRTLLNWNSFNLAPGDTLNFNQGSAASIALNRVVGGAGTIINGNVNSNGQVWFLDSAGIAVGGTAALNVGGVLLSTLGLTDADFFNDNSFHFSGVGGTVAVNGGAALNAANGAVTVLAPGVNFSGGATASGSIALIGARNATLVFDGDLDTYMALTIETGSNENTAISVGSQASFNTASAEAGGRTYLIAAGDSGALGSILLGGSPADAVEFINGDVVLYAAGEQPYSRQLISGGALQTATGTGQGDVTTGALTIMGGSLNVIATDDLFVAAQIYAPAGSVRLESGDMSDISVGVQVGQDYILRAPDWTGGAAFSPTFLNAASGVGDFVIQDTAGGLTIGGRDAPDEFRITTEGGGGLNIVGTITARNGIYLSGGSLSIGGNLTETGGDGVISLVSDDLIFQTAGALTTGTLTVSAGGVAALDGAANAITALGASSAHRLTLVDTGGLTVSGAINGGAGGVSLTTSGDLSINAALMATHGPVSLAATGANADIALNAAVNVGSGTVTLVASGLGATITQNATGAITAGTLTGVSGGATILTAATNAIGNLGSFTASGLSVADTGGLTVSGALNGGPGGIALSTIGDLTVNADVSTVNSAISLTAAGAGADIFLGERVNAGAGTVTLSAMGGGGTIGQATDAVITAGVLTGVSNGATNLGAANQLTQLGAFSANGFTLREANGLVVTGAVAGGAGGVSLATGGDLVLSAGVGATNGSISLTASGAGSDLALAAAINAGTGAVALNADGQISQSAGGVTAGLLTATAGAAVDLGAVAADNNVAQLGAVTAGADVTYRNIDGFNLSGAVSGRDVTLIAESGALALGADVSGRTVSLNADAGALTQSAGVITADTLTGFVSLAASLERANQIDTLNGFVANSLALADVGGLTITGAVGPGAGGGDVLIQTSGGPLTIGATGQVRGGDVVLSTDGAFINQSGADAVSASAKWTVYAASPDTSVFDNLDSGATALWNGTLATRTPASLSGDRYVFAVQPTLTVTTLATSKVYGTDLTGSTSGLYAITGYHAGVAGAFLGDTATTAVSGAPTLSSAGLAERATVAGGPYGITATLGTLASDSGYGFAFSNTGQITVTPKALAANVVALDKTYDGTTDAAGSVSLSGLLSGDAVSTTAGTFTFSDRNAGADKTVTVSGVTLTGADAGNYSVTIPGSVLADILQRALTASVTVSSKTYDGTAAAEGSVGLTGVIAADDVGTTGGSFTFADKNAGAGKTVSISGVTLTGADSGNYTLTVPATALADILQRAITATITASDKTYDGTTAASGSVSLNGVLGSDAVGTTAATFTFADRNAGAAKTVTVTGVTLTGPDAGNYSVTVPASTVADILQRVITATVTASNKTYDGTTAGSGSVGLNGLLDGDVVGATAGTWTFADRNAGAGKTVTVTGVALTGADAGNYSVTIPASALADILQRTITATVAADGKTYDGTTAGSGSVSLEGVLGGDEVGTTDGTFTFADRNAGTAKTVTVAGVSLVGADAGNYTLVLPASITADILRRAITANVSAANKTYDGTTSATGAVALNGVLGGDTVGTTAGAFVFADRNAGVGKIVTVTGVALTGADAGNYSLTVPASTLASILRRAITVSADAASKGEGMPDPTFTYAVTGGNLVSGDTLTGAPERAAGESPGQYAITQGSLAASANYQLTFMGNTLTITAGPISSDTHPATIQEVQDLADFLSSYETPDSRRGPLIVADERDDCDGGLAQGNSACLTGGGG